jgi:hypothetical protein
MKEMKVLVGIIFWDPVMLREITHRFMIFYALFFFSSILSLSQSFIPSYCNTTTPSYPIPKHPLNSTHPEDGVETLENAFC